MTMHQSVTVVGAGVAGLTCALQLAERGVRVCVLERSDAIGPSTCSWYAGAMLAPWCEGANAEPAVTTLGIEGIAWWSERFADTQRFGTLVLAHSHDQAELIRLSQRTRGWHWLDQDGIAALEPDLAGRFHRALWFAEEAHLDPRAALAFLAKRLLQLGGTIRYGVDAALDDVRKRGVVIDCSGFAARHVLTDLRGVRGEMLMLRSSEFSLRRPVRVLHPRVPFYIVPRGAGLFMVGATMIESDASGCITARSLLELLNAAHALHPALAEAQVVETGAQVRAAFANNLPQLRWQGARLYVNGFFRHGFLLAPALGRMAADAALGRALQEISHEDHRQRHLG